MALPNVGGGYQVADGNTSEVTMTVRPQVGAITAAYTLTNADFASGIVSATSSGSYAVTTPTGVLMDAALTNAKVGSSFEFSITHGSATNVITLTGGTGVTVVGLATVTGITSATWVFRKTGANTWSAYRI